MKILISFPKECLQKWQYWEKWWFGKGLARVLFTCTVKWWIQVYGKNGNLVKIAKKIKKYLILESVEGSQSELWIFKIDHLFLSIWEEVGISFRGSTSN